MQHTEKLSITLPSEMVRIIRDKVADGGYSSNSEVIREALRGWMEQSRRVQAMDASIQRGLEDANANRVQDVTSVRSDLQARFSKIPS